MCIRHLPFRNLELDPHRVFTGSLYDPLITPTDITRSTLSVPRSSSHGTMPILLLGDTHPSDARRALSLSNFPCLRCRRSCLLQRRLRISSRILLILCSLILPLSKTLRIVSLSSLPVVLLSTRLSPHTPRTRTHGQPPLTLTPFL